MNTFVDALNKTLGNEYNVSVTENGAVGYRTTQHTLLDMNFKVNSYRKMSEEEIIRDFINAYNEDGILAVKWAFFVRDAREGLGERRLFRVIMRYLAKTKTDMVKKLLPIMAEYGRWDDVLDLYVVSDVRKDVAALVKKTLTEDMESMAGGKPISLLAKWMPSINTSSKETVALARELAKVLGVTEKQYRKMLSALRAKLKVVEKQLSANEWGEVNYEAVPSKANLLYRNAFLKHDEERRRAFLEALDKGEVKINSSVNFPSDIVHKYMSDYRYWNYGNHAIKRQADLEGLWKALPNYGIEDTICVADGSGSMFTTVDSNSSVRAIEVANALAIYCAEHCTGEFKNKYITFSSRPQLVALNGNSLAQNLSTTLTHNEMANTNVEAVFDLILRTAVQNKMSQAELPKNILILSDMEFDCATSYCNANLFKVIGKKYAACGYKLPRLIFWNIASRTGTIPVKENELGVALVSGYSVNTLKMVLSGEFDPYNLLVKTLSATRYDLIDEVLGLPVKGK